MTELELMDKLNQKRDLPQATCDVIHMVWEVMNKETVELKDEISELKVELESRDRIIKNFDIFLSKIIRDAKSLIS